LEDPANTVPRRRFPLRHSLISALADLDIRGVRRIARSLPGLLIPEPGGACIMRTLHGFWLRIDPVRDEGVERSIYYTGTYEKGALAVMKRILGQGDLFVDAGANIGLMSLFASGLVGRAGRVYAFEPNPETAAILRENIRINGAENIEVSECAIGRRPGKARIYERWDLNRGSATLIRPEVESGSHEVTVTTLSEFLRDKRPVRLVKLDIEGFEPEALQGAMELLQREDPPVLMVECSEIAGDSSAGGPRAIYDLLAGGGRYRIFRGRGGKGRVSRLVEVKGAGEMPPHDNIYCFTGDHIRRIPAGMFK
jgi:FkbM family methyltransferase